MDKNEIPIRRIRVTLGGRPVEDVIAEGSQQKKISEVDTMTVKAVGEFTSDLAGKAHPKPPTSDNVFEDPKVLGKTTFEEAMAGGGLAGKAHPKPPTSDNVFEDPKALGKTTFGEAMAGGGLAEAQIQMAIPHPYPAWEADVIRANVRRGFKKREAWSMVEKGTLRHYMEAYVHVDEQQFNENVDLSEALLDLRLWGRDVQPIKVKAKKFHAQIKIDQSVKLGDGLKDARDVAYDLLGPHALDRLKQAKAEMDAREAEAVAKAEGKDDGYKLRTDASVMMMIGDSSNEKHITTDE